MGLISKPNTFSAGGTVIASEHNSNFDTIYNEFNGNISNTNISGSAAIADTKLAQITTSGKVSVEALTGSYSKVNLTEGSAPTTAASEGALYTKDTSGQPELFYREESNGDEVQLTSGGMVNLPLGTWASRTPGTIYQAATDGFLVCYLVASNSGYNVGYVDGLTDSSTPPTVARTGANVYTHTPQTAQSQYNIHNGFCMPVKKGDYYQGSTVTGTGTVTATYYWIPLGG